MNLCDKVILTDVDGVLIDWEYAFSSWMKRHHKMEKIPGHYDMSVAYSTTKEEMNTLIRIFNESATVYNMPPLRDAVKYVKKLHEEHGYIFHVISSLSNDYNSQYLRTKNLKNLFGETVFEKFIYLDTGAPKDHVLEEYRDTNCVFVEDKIENAIVGDKMGLQSILMEHHFNKECDIVLRMKNWKEIYQFITGEC